MKEEVDEEEVDALGSHSPIVGTVSVALKQRQNTDGRHQHTTTESG